MTLAFVFHLFLFPLFLIMPVHMLCILLYLLSNCFEVLVEMNCCKYPLAKKLPVIWMEHKPALMAYLKQVHKGIKGFIMDRCGSGLAGAVIKVDQRNKTIISGTILSIVQMPCHIPLLKSTDFELFF